MLCNEAKTGAAHKIGVRDGFRGKRGLRSGCLLNYDSCTHHEMNAADINESSEAEKRHFYECQLFVAGAIILDVVALRRFETVREAGKEGQAIGLGLILAVAAIIMLLGSNL
jgi:hypothetical protein